MAAVAKQGAASQQKQRNFWVSLLKGTLRFLGVGDEYIQKGVKGVQGWFAGATIKKGDKFVYTGAQGKLFTRYGGIGLRIGQIYAGIKLPFWLVGLPFKAGDGLVDYSRRRVV